MHSLSSEIALWRGMIETGIEKAVEPANIWPALIIERAAQGGPVSQVPGSDPHRSL